MHCRKTLCWRLAKEIRLLLGAPAALSLAPMVHWPECDDLGARGNGKPCSAEPSDALASSERIARAPGAAGPTVLLQCYREIWRTGAGSGFEKKKSPRWVIKTICLLHGPALTERLEECLRFYDLWLVATGNQKNRRAYRLPTHPPSMEILPMRRRPSWVN